MQATPLAVARVDRCECAPWCREVALQAALNPVGAGGGRTSRSPAKTIELTILKKEIEETL